jgi:hypothetical protein
MTCLGNASAAFTLVQVSSMWDRRRRLSCLLKRGGPAVPLLPLNVAHLQQGHIIFDRESLEVVKGNIAFHRLAKIVNGKAELVERRCLHGTRGLR